MRFPIIAFILAAAFGCEQRAAGSFPSAEDLHVPIRLTVLEPDARTAISYVDWTVTTADGTHEGRTPIVSASDPIRFSFSGDATVTSIALRGFDQMDRLRAVGRVSEASLRAASPSEPAALAFFLLDEFQTYPETMDVSLRGHVVVSATSGNPVILGGFEASVSEGRRQIVEFDPLRGAFVEIGDLSVPRKIPGALTFADGRTLIASDETAEIWDPLARASIPLQGTFSSSRPFGPSILEIGPELWVVGGTDTTLSESGELVDVSTGVVGSTVTEIPGTNNYRGFPALFVNGTATAGVYEIVRWYSDFVTRYRSDAAGEQSSTQITPRVSSPMRLDRSNQAVLVDRLGFCTHFRTVGFNGDPAASVAIPLVEQGVCYPGVALLEDDKMLFMGGERTAQAMDLTRDVRIYDFTAQDWNVPTTPDGRPIELRSPRSEFVPFWLPNGALLVIGGKANHAGDVELPRVEILVPSSTVN